MKCPKCGNNVPDGSAFCNQCGTPLNSDIQCPSCNSSIPANSVFCPKCGKKVVSDVNEGETFNQQQARLRQEQEAEAARLEAERLRQEEAERLRQEEAERLHQEELRRQQAAAALNQQADPWKKPEDNDDEEDDEEAAPKSNYNRNLMMGIAIVVGVIILLMLLRTCGNDSDRSNPALADSTAVENLNGQDPLAIFNSEMGRSNYMGDGATTATALLVPEHNGKPNYILGITFQSNPSNRSFYKIYKVTQNGSAWVLEQLHTQYINGRSLSFNNSELIAADGQTPRAVTIDGKDYFYYAYMNMPQGAHVGGTGRVSLCLYDVEEHKLTTLDYDGIINVREDGRQYVYGKPLQSVNSSLTRFLAQEAQSIKVIYFPTEEELKAQEEEEEKAEEEASLEGPDNAAARWNADNNDKMASAKGGQEVTMKAQSYDKPIFKMENKHKSIQNDEYIVFSDKSGAVYGFNKSSRKYFVIYTPSSPTSPTDIGFADSENSIINMRTADGRFQYNLKSDKLKTNNE